MSPFTAPFTAHGSGTTTYTYDNAGNQTLMVAPGSQRTTSTWNDENKRTQVQTPGGTTMDCEYRFDGLRYEKQASGATTRFLYDGQNYLAETDGTGSVKLVLTNKPNRYGSLISQYVNIFGSTFVPVYQHYDALGSTAAITTSAQAVVNSYHYGAWGDIISSTEGIFNNFKWVGELGYYYDMQVEDYYVRARNYSLRQARWNSQDPIGLAGGDVNYFRYVFGSPVIGFDPSGLWFWEVASVLGNVVVGAATGAAAGAVTGAVTGALIGFAGGGPAGALAGLAAGASAGAIAGAIAGGVSAGIRMIGEGANFNPIGSASSGAVGGALGGVLPGIGAGAGALAGGGRGALVHWTTREAHAVITTSHRLGRTASSSLWATTGSGAATTVAGREGVRITGNAAAKFFQIRAIGMFSAYGRAAGFHSAGSGVLNLQTGTFVLGGGANRQLLQWYAFDLAISGAVGAASRQLPDPCGAKYTAGIRVTGFHLRFESESNTP